MSRIYAGYDPVAQCYYIKLEKDIKLAELSTIDKSYKWLGFTGVAIKRREA